MKAHPGTLPAAATAGTLAEAAFVLVAAGLAAIFLVFPSGRLPSPRWRPAVLAGLVLTGLSVASFVVSTRTVALPAPGGIPLTYPNPLAVRALRPFAWLGTLNGLAVLLLLLLGSAVVSLALRYRRGDQRLRQQMKWLGLAFARVLACQAVGALSIAAGQENKPLQTVPYVITPFLVYVGIPAAMAIAILRRRLFDIDVIISRALLVTIWGSCAASPSLAAAVGVVRACRACTCPPSKWVELPMLLPGRFAESGTTPTDRTASTEIRSDLSEGDHHDPGHHDRRGRRPFPEGVRYHRRRQARSARIEGLHRLP